MIIRVYGWLQQHLVLAPLLQMLYQVIANQFLVVKKTWPTVLILSTGAVVNLLFNYFLIPVLGIEGAAIGTVLGYAILDIVCTIVLLRMKLMVISQKFVFSVVAMLVYLGTWRTFYNSSILISLLCTSVLVLLFGYIYRIELVKLYKLLRHD